VKSIGLLSDTHSFLDPRIAEYFSACDEIWHAGDIGSIRVAEQLSRFKTFRAVHGNIDGQDIRSMYPADLVFLCEEMKIFITHIGGYPGNYFPEAGKKISAYQPDLFICGHSHILKIMRDEKYHLLHINPGAAGKSGFHKMRTLVRFHVNGKKIEKLEVIELGLRASIEAGDPSALS